MVMTNNPGPLVTIAIPTYNRADDYLGQALESAVKQTYYNIEIIVADNCSTDHTELVVKRFDDPSIRYFKQRQNIGAAANWNFCLKQAKGVYFLLLQDDDLIDHDFIDVCMKAARYSPDIAIIRTGTRIIDSYGQQLREKLNLAGGLSTEEFIIAVLSGRLWMFLCGSLFNTNRLREMGDCDSRWTGTQYRHWVDVYTETALAVRFSRIDVKDIKASFRTHPSSITNNVDVREWVEDSIIFLNALCRWSPENESKIRNLGRRYFARNCYDIARGKKSRIERVRGYFIVYRNFKVTDFKIPSIYEIICKTPLYYPLRFIKVQIKQAFGRS